MTLTYVVLNLSLSTRENGFGTDTHRENSVAFRLLHDEYQLMIINEIEVQAAVGPLAIHDKWDRVVLNQVVIQS